MAENFASCWNLDSTGNWSGMKQASSGGLWDLEQSRSANTANEIAAIHNSFGTSWANPGYDAAGNMTTIPQPLSMGDTFAATWDAWNRLVKLVEDSNIVAEYGYDASRRRIIKKRYTGGTFIETQHVYLSANWQTLEVRLDVGVSADQQYIWGLRYIDDLLVRDRNVTNPLDERIYAMQEVQWNVIALADASGDVVQRFSYHPYGESQVLTSAFTSSSDSYHWQYRFTSREHDLDTGLDYFRNRYWHNLVGVFITRDLLEYVDGASMYAGYFVPRRMDAWGNASVTMTLAPEKPDDAPFAYYDLSFLAQPGVNKVLGNTFRQFKVNCECDDCKDDKGNCGYKVSKCSITYKQFIMIDKNVISSVNRSVDGTYGHEQLHVKNTIEFAKKLKTKLEETLAKEKCYSPEKQGIEWDEIAQLKCKTRNTELMNNILELDSKQEVKSSDHEYETPKKGTDYNPIGRMPNESEIPDWVISLIKNRKNKMK